MTMQSRDTEQIPTLTRAAAVQLLQRLKRRPDSYKNDYGRVLVMAGSVGMAGAAVLCSRAALRTGSGLVRCCVPAEIRSILQVAVPEATCLPRSREALEAPAEAIAAGPGLGDHREDAPLLQHLLQEYGGTLVLDADGLNDITRFGLAAALRQARPEVVLTPHPGEAARLLGRERIDDRREAAAELAARTQATVVMKGHETLILAPGGQICCNRETGNPGMATGGSGDVLTGIIASLAGQGLPAYDAARAGVYLHGLAGDLCAAQTGEAGLIAGDLCPAVPQALRRLIEDPAGEIEEN
ncbi:MAG: NAD(P)H-hydrate dehydratase [Anaerovoracaceae bacterium]|jgi:hydroxyethylthiazole kinase-like uncharacterized protein yjeF